VGLYTRIKPIRVIYDIGVPEHDGQGRVLTAEFKQFYLVAVYVPTVGEFLKNLDYRIKNWDVDF